MTPEQAMEMAEAIEQCEDWPGDAIVIECIIALRDRILELEELLLDGPAQDE